MRSLNVLYGAVAVGVMALMIGVYLLTRGHHWSAYAGIGIGVLFLVGGVTALVTTRGAKHLQS